jgi:hypothetical protein
MSEMETSEHRVLRKEDVEWNMSGNQVEIPCSPYKRRVLNEYN